MSKRKILVTSALPYANGPLHLGHLIEYIQTDIWVRFQKMVENHCLYVCADDAHGTAISLHAQKQNMSPEDVIEKIHKERIQNFSAFHIAFDHYHSTHSSENQQLVHSIYSDLKKKGYITTKEITQAYDPKQKLFLADRYIQGTCPHCDALNQYGDNCEQCGATYDPTDLKDAKSTLSGATPIQKTSQHYFFKMSHFETFLTQWVHSNTVPKEVAKKLDEWLTVGLKDWDISRDAPYFGIQIPDAPGKFFYVWLDAPIGYMAAFKYLCLHTPSLNFDDYWKPDSTYELHHFIGKDIINFHCLFWPAILEGAEYRTPTQVHVHGYLTVNRQKMSKSKGSLIAANEYLKHLQPEYLRYYYAAKLSSRIDDIDLNAEDFTLRVNSDLVGKLINIASRCSGFLHKQFGNILSTRLNDSATPLINECKASEAIIADLYENLEYSKAMRHIMKLADQANTWIDHMQPWIVAKEGNQTAKQKLHEICSTGINVFRLLIIYLKPVIPAIAKEVEYFLNIKPLAWKDSQAILLDHQINPFKPLITRVDIKSITKLMNLNLEEQHEKISEANQQNLRERKKPQTLHNEPILEQITLNDFAKIDLRIVKIIHAETITGADKLLRLVLDLGDGSTRQVFSGIKLAYNPDELIGKNTVMVVNLPTKKNKFGTSEGMILAAGPGGKDLWILEPHEGAKPGMKVS